MNNVGRLVSNMDILDIEAVPVKDGEPTARPSPVQGTSHNIQAVGKVTYDREISRRPDPKIAGVSDHRRPLVARPARIDISESRNTVATRKPKILIRDKAVRLLAAYLSMWAVGSIGRPGARKIAAATVSDIQDPKQVTNRVGPIP